MTTPASERVGDRFSIEAMKHARIKSWEMLSRIADRIVPGMREEDAMAMAAHLLETSGMDRLWHPVIIRFGQNTLKTYRQRSAPDTVLGEDDIFFIDLGLVWGGHEGDVGDTFVTGADPIRAACAQAARTLFDRVAEQWRRERVTGQVLYDYASEQAAAMGWNLNHQIKGHRVSDFPHAIYKAGDLGDFAGTPEPGLWILEIQIAHPELPIGGFFEDLLIDVPQVMGDDRQG
jgi:Xaa-Pro aminopeptidase